GEITRTIQADARLHGIWESSHKRAVAAAIDTLSENGIASVISKGTALAYCVFPDPAMRQRGDTDLIICASDVARTRKVFEDLGWVRGETSSMQENWSYDTGAGFVHTIDLHWQANASAATRLLFTPEEAIARSTSLQRLSQSARALDPALLFLAGGLNQVLHAVAGYLVEHETVYGDERLIWSFGNHLQLKAFTDADWNILAQEAGKRGAAYLCRTTVEATRARFGTEVPAHFLAALEGSGTSGDIDAYLFEQGSFARLATSLRSAYGLRDLLAILSHNFLMDEIPLRRRYPAMQSYPLAVLQTRRWLDGVSKLVMPRGKEGFARRISPTDEHGGGHS
ncbi:MAG: nucleotidyltransferase family protein, partial [Alteraurantiacibacter sp.]